MLGGGNINESDKYYYMGKMKIEAIINMSEGQHFVCQKQK